MKNIQKTIYYFLFVAAIAVFFAACSKPKVVDRGLSESNLDATFTITPVAGSANKFILTSTDSSYIMSKWDIGDGAGATRGNHQQQIFLPDAGTYTITHSAVGKGGISFSASKTITVATSDPAAGNLVQGGKFETAADDANWTRLTIGAPAIAWNMSGGKMVATGGSWGHSGIYQAITIQADKDYKFGMLVSGSGASDCWFEVYFGTVIPVQNSDYSSGGNQIGLNTWTGCGNTAFSGNIATIGCTGALVGKAGKVRFTTGGTIYLLIKCGGNSLGASGISIDNVELRGI